MKRHHPVIVLLVLALSSCLASFSSYSSTRWLVSEDIDRALVRTMEEQQCDVISKDTIRTFNSYLHIAELRGKVTLAVDTRESQFTARAHCSEATIFRLSNQRPASVLWALTGLWALLMFYRQRRGQGTDQPLQPARALSTYGNLAYSAADGAFYDAAGNAVRLTPMQHQLMEMFFHAPAYSLSKDEICDALWPKKPDASETLYTLIRRLKLVVQQHSDLQIESERGGSYRLTVR